MPIKWMVDDMTGKKPKVKIKAKSVMRKTTNDIKCEKLDEIKAKAMLHAKSPKRGRYACDYEKDLARKMRSLGATLDEIGGALERSTGTVSVWVKDIKNEME